MPDAGTRLTAAHMPEAERPLIRPVALAYRRARRARAAERDAYDAAAAEYHRLRPEASAEELSGVYGLIAAAINADPQWFWQGPDA